MQPDESHWFPYEFSTGTFFDHPAVCKRAATGELVCPAVGLVWETSTTTTLAEGEDHAKAYLRDKSHVKVAVMPPMYEQSSGVSSDDVGWPLMGVKGPVDSGDDIEYGGNSQAAAVEDSGEAFEK